MCEASAEALARTETATTCGLCRGGTGRPAGHGRARRKSPSAAMRGHGAGLLVTPPRASTEVIR